MRTTQSSFVGFLYISPNEKIIINIHDIKNDVSDENTPTRPDPIFSNTLIPMRNLPDFSKQKANNYSHKKTKTNLQDQKKNALLNPKAGKP